MEPGVELCPVLLPGRETRLSEPPLREMSALVTALADGLQGAMDRPYALLGYSLGSTVAFELVRELRRRNHPLPQRLFIASRHAPQFCEPACIAHLSRDAFVRALQERYNAIPAPVLADRDLMAMFLPILRADFSLLENYRYDAGEPISVPITAWYGRQDVTLTRAQMEAWREHTTAHFELIALEASHFFHTDPRLLQGLTRRLRSP
jgi:medium-chain acyl-[acyl-carrier-protein] hydrolase